MIIKAKPGETTFSTAKRAIEAAKKDSCQSVSMEHNDVRVNVYAESYIHDILEKLHYLREYKILNKSL